MQTAQRRWLVAACGVWRRAATTVGSLALVALVAVVASVTLVASGTSAAAVDDSFPRTYTWESSHDLDIGRAREVWVLRFDRDGTVSGGLRDQHVGTALTQSAWHTYDWVVEVTGRHDGSTFDVAGTLRGDTLVYVPSNTPGDDRYIQCFIQEGTAEWFNGRIFDDRVTFAIVHQGYHHCPEDHPSAPQSGNFGHQRGGVESDMHLWRADAFVDDGFLHGRVDMPVPPQAPATPAEPMPDPDDVDGEDAIPPGADVVPLPPGDAGAVVVASGQDVDGVPVGLTLAAGVSALLAGAGMLLLQMLQAGQPSLISSGTVAAGAPQSGVPAPPESTPAAPRVASTGAVPPPSPVPGGPMPPASSPVEQGRLPQPPPEVSPEVSHTAGVGADVDADAALVAPRRGDRMVAADGREYVWHLPVDDDAPTPFWVAAEHVEEERRMLADGRVFDDGRWHEDRGAAQAARERRTQVEADTRARQQREAAEQLALRQQREAESALLAAYTSGERVDPAALDGLDLDPSVRSAADQLRVLAIEETVDRQIAELEARMGEVINQRRDEGYYVKNRSLLTKAYNNSVGRVMDVLTGHTGGQCGEFGDWGAEWSEEMIREIAGEDAIITRITVERNVLNNHRATRVILPSGERIVLEYWEGMAAGEPRIYREADWVRRWRDQLRRQLPGDGTIHLVESDVHYLELQLDQLLTRNADQLAAGERTIDEVLEQFNSMGAKRGTGDVVEAERRARAIVADSYRRNGSVFNQLDRLDAADAAAAQARS